MIYLLFHKFDLIYIFLRHQANCITRGSFLLAIISLELTTTRWLLFWSGQWVTEKALRNVLLDRPMAVIKFVASPVNSLFPVKQTHHEPFFLKNSSPSSSSPRTVIASKKPDNFRNSWVWSCQLRGKARCFDPLERDWPSEEEATPKFQIFVR